MEAINKKEPNETAAQTIARFRGEFKEGKPFRPSCLYVKSVPGSDR